MLVSTASWGKTCAQLCLQTCTSLLSTRGGPITALCTAAQTMVPWSSRDHRQLCTVQAQVSINSVQLVPSFTNSGYKNFIEILFSVTVKSCCQLGCQIRSSDSRSINSRNKLFQYLFIGDVFLPQVNVINEHNDYMLIYRQVCKTINLTLQVR